MRAVDMPSGCKKSFFAKGRWQHGRAYTGGAPLTSGRQGDAPTGYDTVSAQFRLYDLQNGVATCDSEGLKQCGSNTWQVEPEVEV
jgi:hypothetical protein